jgi:hypothetical protein
MATNIIDPIAQTFIIDEQNFPNGLFLSSISLFFKSKPSTNIPIRLSIVSTLNGYPTGQTLDYSVVTLYAENVNVSAAPHYKNPNSATKFTFDSPVYINPGVLYAFVLQTSSESYELWSAQQNDSALLSTSKPEYTDPDPSSPTKIVTTPYVGDLFESQNSLTWTASQTKDLMFIINRCKFNINTAPTLSFVVPKGLPKRMRIESNTATATSNSTYDAINVSTTDLTPSGTALTYQYTTTLNTGAADGPYTVIPGKFGTPKSTDIYLNDNRGPRVLNYASNSSFKIQATFSSVSDAVSPVIAQDGFNLWTTRYRINDMGLANDNIYLISGGTGYLANANGSISYPEISVSAPDAIDGTQAYVSADIEMGNIVSVYVTTQGSGYLKTPTIVVSNTSNVVANVVVAGETSPAGGNGLARYLTNTVTLAEGNDSGDLRVYLTAYRPSNSDVLVYYKIVARDDTQVFDDGDWQLMTMSYSSGKYSVNRSDLIEYEYAPGRNNVANNSVSYTSKTTGTSYTSFYQFAIKVVLRSSDSTFAPFVKDLRAIALPSGTGA